MSLQLESFAAESMDNFWGHLEKGHLDRSIAFLRRIGYSATAIDFALSPDSYYLPTHDGARLQRPSGLSDDMIPVVALHRDQEYEFESPVLHSLQQESLQKHDIDTAAVAKRMQEFGRTTLSSVKGGSETASVYRGLASLDGDDRQIESRPTVILNPEFTQTELEPICASAVLHELVHVAQSLNDPIWDGRNVLQKELEAYAVQAQLVDSFDVPYSTATAMAGQVNLSRKRYLGDDGFVPSPEFTNFARYDATLSKIVKDN